MVRKIDYMHHVLSSVCTYMPLNGASKREIIDDVRKKLKRRVGEDVNAEVRKALSAGLKSELLEKQNGKYKLKISTIRDKFRDTDIIPIDDHRRPHCTTCGTKIFLDRGRLRSRRRLRARSVVSGRALTRKGNEVSRVVGDKLKGAKSRKNVTMAVDAINGKKSSSKATVIKDENAGSSSHRIKKSKSLTRKRIRRHVYTQHHQHNHHQPQQQQQQQQQQMAAVTPKKLTIVLPMSNMKVSRDMSDSNAIDEYNQKTFSLDDASGFKHRINESHSDQYSFLQRSRSLFD